MQSLLEYPVKAFVKIYSVRSLILFIYALLSRFAYKILNSQNVYAMCMTY
jgi:hypothetical protein